MAPWWLPELQVSRGVPVRLIRRRRRPPYQTGKTVHVHAKHYKHNEDGRMAPDVCGNGSVPLSHSGNVVTRIGIHTHTHTHTHIFQSEAESLA